MALASLTLPDNEVATVPLLFEDQTNRAVHAPASGGSVSSSDPAVATASLAADDASVVVTAMSDGACTISYSNGSLSDTLSVTVAAPTPTSVQFDTGHTTFAPKP